MIPNEDSTKSDLEQILVTERLGVHFLAVLWVTELPVGWISVKQIGIIVQQRNIQYCGSI